MIGDDGAAADHGYYHYFHLDDNRYTSCRTTIDLKRVDDQELLKVRRFIKKNDQIPVVERVGVGTAAADHIHDLAHCVGSSHGWLAFMDPTYFSISLVNPLIHEQQHFRLPPICGAEQYYSNFEDAAGSSSTTTGAGVPFVQKMALSSPPPYNGDEDGDSSPLVILLSTTTGGELGGHRHLATN